MTKLILNESDKLLHYPIKCDSYANINNALDIWIKFSNYLKPEELSFMEELNNKEFNFFTHNDFSEYSRIKNQIRFSSLLLKYKNKECSKEEHDFVCEFMDSTSLKSFVRNRLNRNQKDSALQFVSKITLKSDLENYIQLNENKYDDLTVYEAYILFIAKEKLYDIHQKELNQGIKSKQLERKVSLVKSITNDYLPKF